MATVINGSIGSIVNLDEGQISREIFVNEDIYAQEQEQVFSKAWLFVGHETQVPKPGDYFVSSMGEESVILCRDREGEIHVFLNSCTHRGMKVCRYDEGNTPVFSCPYHGWSFATDGKLVGVPYFKDAYKGALDKSQWGLIEVPQMHNYKGGIWASWDKNGPSFQEYLGDFTMYLDLLMDGRDGSEGGSEILGGVQKWTMPNNWKFAAENFAGRRLPQHQPPLGGHGGHRPQRAGPPRRLGVQGRPPHQRVHAAARPRRSGGVVPARHAADFHVPEHG